MRPTDVTPRDRVDMAALPPGENADKTAVVICHGMGQQVRWQTLATLVDTLRQTGRVTSVATRLARFSDNEGELILGRVEVTVNGPDGRAHELHLYEPYWAPLAEGRVFLRDVVAFLKDAATRGMRHSFRPFVRFMFGQPREFPPRSCRPSAPPPSASTRCSTRRGCRARSSRALRRYASLLKAG